MPILGGRLAAWGGSAAGEGRHREAAERGVEDLGDVRDADGLAAAGLEGRGDLQAAAGVGGYDQARASGPQRGRLTVAELPCRIRLQQVVDTCRAAARAAVAGLGHVQARDAA